MHHSTYIELIALAALASISMANGEVKVPNFCASSPCGPGATCTSSSISFICTCNNTHRWYDYTAKACKDINECMANPCPGIATGCIDSPGGFTCTCRPGYEWLHNATINVCADIDECAVGSHNCGSNSTCVNLDGSFLCACPTGFYYDPRAANGTGACLDSDECMVNPCPSTATGCTNTIGAFKCTCTPGSEWSMDEYSSECVDIDECNRQLHNCGGNSSCVNFRGGYKCVCLPGFYYDAKARTCKDVDECASAKPPCGPMSRCQNLPGSFQCSCLKGAPYVYDPIVYDCVKPINPCLTNPCGPKPNACVRTNTSINSYECHCPTKGSLSVLMAPKKPTCYNASIHTSVGFIISTRSNGSACMDIQWNYRYDQNILWQWDYNGNPAQVFFLKYAGDNAYLIKDSNRQYVVGTAGGGDVIGTPIVLSILNATHPAGHQQWSFTRRSTTDNWFQISPKHAPHQCITVVEDSLDRGAPLELGPCLRASPGQWFQILPQ